MRDDIQTGGAHDVLQENGHAVTHMVVEQVALIVAHGWCKVVLIVNSSPQRVEAMNLVKYIQHSEMRIGSEVPFLGGSHSGGWIFSDRNDIFCADGYHFTVGNSSPRSIHFRPRRFPIYRTFVVVVIAKVAFDLDAGNR